jgi:SAM-dependent methyltransferase
MAAIGRLHGLRPAEVTRARVLEIGCGDGGHLLPLAAFYPGATFVGCDLAPTAIAHAERRARAANLDNVALHVADVRALPDLGRFDFIVSHGVYSWVPEDAREALLAACGASLAGDGIAFVSYNAMPGGHLRHLVRDVLLFHVAGIDDPAKRLDEARGLARRLASDDEPEDADNAALRFELRRMLERSDQSVTHDDLAPVQQAFSITEFAARAHAHGLAFLGEAEYHADFTGNHSAQARAFLAGMGRLAREQYLDFFTCRRFRQTLLCRSGREIADDADPRAIDDLYVGAPRVKRAAADADVSRAGSVPRMRALVAAVHDRAPAALAFGDVCAACGLDPGDEAARDEARALVLAATRTRLLQLSACSSPAASGVSRTPEASGYARLQAAEGDRVTNADMVDGRLDDLLARALLARLDGTRDAGALAASLAAEGVRDVGQAWVDEALARLAKLGLLVA